MPIKCPTFLLAAFMSLFLCPVGLAQVPVDALLTMNNVSPSAPGTQLSQAIIANGTIGNLGGGACTLNGTSSALTVAAHQAPFTLGTSISVAGRVYGPALQTQSFALDTNSNFTYITCGVSPAGHPKVTVSGFLKLPDATGNFQVFDWVRIDGTSSAFVLMQSSNGGGATSCLRIEVNPNPTSGCITVNQGTSVFFSLLYDSSGGTAKLAVFNPTYPFSQIGSTVTIAQTTGQNAFLLKIGNLELGQVAGPAYFENIMVDATNAVFPLAVPNLSAPWAGILSPTRAIDWKQAGVVGGVPNRTTVCSTLTAGSTSAQINSAIAACPSGQAVLLSAGTYSGLSGIDFTGHPNVTLRGAGANVTLLVFTSTTTCNLPDGTLICIGGTDNNWKGGPSNLVNWTAGYYPGATIITLASVPNLRVGNPIILDQLDGDQNSGCDSGGIFVSQITTTCAGALSPGITGPFSLEGNNGGVQRTGRQQIEIKTVAACNGNGTPGTLCTGTNVAVTISPGLYMANWNSSQTPQAWWATTPITGVGVENLSIDGTAVTAGTGVEFKNAINSWVRGVRIIDTNRAHVQMEWSTHITSSQNYEFLTQDSASQSYGDDCFGASDLLIESNIYHAIAGPILINGGTNVVAAYNFTVNQYYTVSPGWNEPSTSVHTAGAAFLLYEGNISSTHDNDVFHGTHHFVTDFRNYWSGTQPKCYASGATYSASTYAACTNDRVGIRYNAFTRFSNAIANVIGTTGAQTTYQGGGDGSVFVVGDGNTNGTVTVPTDPNVSATLLRYGNYDVVTAATRWCGDSTNTGFATTCSSTSEVPLVPSANVQTGFSNPEPTVGDTVAGQAAMPASFYYPATPSWWPGNKAWPLIGPDVTGGNISGVGGHAYTNPAQDCYLNMGGLSDGTGHLLTFNANTCYGSNINFDPKTAPAGALFAKKGH